MRPKRYPYKKPAQRQAEKIKIVKVHLGLGKGILIKRIT